MASSSPQRLFLVSFLLLHLAAGPRGCAAIECITYSLNGGVETKMDKKSCPAPATHCRYLVHHGDYITRDCENKSEEWRTCMKAEVELAGGKKEGPWEICLSGPVTAFNTANKKCHDKLSTTTTPSSKMVKRSTARFGGPTFFYCACDKEDRCNFECGYLNVTENPDCLSGQPGENFTIPTTTTTTTTTTKKPTLTPKSGAEDTPRVILGLALGSMALLHAWNGF